VIPTISGLGQGGDDATTAAIDLDVAFDLLANPRRRRAIKIVAAEDPVPVLVTDLASQLAMEETGTTHREHTPRGAREHAYASLYETNVPRLEDVGALAIQYDDDFANAVVATETTHAFADAIDDVERRLGGAQS